MTGPRHLLVVASQCAAMSVLPKLAEVARGLHDVLSDAELGDCRAGLPDGRALLVLEDGKQTSGDVYQAVRDAIAYAAASGATLVLAMIGHGFIPGEDPTLYFMAPASQDQIRDKAVKVSELLLEAADRPGIAGVIGIVDTCNAAGAAVSTPQLTAGVRAGRTTLTVIMASASGQDAYGLTMSRALTDILRSGSTEAGAAVFAHDVETPLRNRLSRQTLAMASYNGKDGGQEAVWLAANPCHAITQNRGSVTSSSASRLVAALHAVDPSAPVPERLDESALRDLGKQAANWKPPPGAEWDLAQETARIRLGRLADDLTVAVRTAAFLRSWLSDSLTPARLRTAVARLRPGPHGRLLSVPGSAFSRMEDVVEHLAVNHPGPRGDCRKWIARFVVAFAQEAGRALDAPELLAWAQGVDAVIEFNEARDDALAGARERRLRLIVSFHASPAGGWPPTLDAWLLNGAEQIDNKVFDTRAVPDRAGSEQALADAVDWAEGIAEELALELQRVEVAVPSTRLVDWRPEEASAKRKLGVDYDIVLRWSLRMNPPSDRAWINSKARKRWKLIAKPPGTAPVDWLSRHQTDNIRELHDLLRDGHYMQALGLDHTPGGVSISGADLLDLLLTFSPVVLWPGEQDGFPSHCQTALNDYWHTLPTGLIDAYREQWGKKTEADPDDVEADPGEAGAYPGDVVARLRAVWDDLEWLDFCAKQRRMETARQGGPR